MDIKWHGRAMFSLEGEGVRVVLDPLDSVGLDSEARVIVRSERPRTASPSAQGDPFVIDGPGEYEVDGTFIIGRPGPGDDDTRRTIYAITLGDVTVCQVGRLRRVPKEAELAALGEIDVLLLPIGDDALNAAHGAELVGRMEPSIVIPAASPADGPAMMKFLSELGAADAEASDSFRALAHRMPDEPTVARLRPHATG